MNVVLDEARAQTDLAGSLLRCPRCAGRLRRWGFARSRSLHAPGGGHVPLRPRRVRCTSYAVTHVLLPAIAPARHAYAIDVVGQVLLARALGRSHRTVGAKLEMPPDTVRGWIRRATARAEWLRVEGTATVYQFDSMLPATVPAGSPLADAVSVLGAAASAVVRVLGQAANRPQNPLTLKPPAILLRCKSRSQIARAQRASGTVSAPNTRTATPAGRARRSRARPTPRRDANLAVWTTRPDRVSTPPTTL